MITTILNLEVTDYCFVKCANFIKYEKFQTSITGRIAEKRTSFEIARYGIVKIAVEVVNRRIINLTLHDVLYIPDLYSNLISISKICRLDLAIIFGENEVIASLSNSKTAIYSVRHRSLYHIMIVDKPKMFVVKCCSNHLVIKTK